MTPRSRFIHEDVETSRCRDKFELEDGSLATQIRGFGMGPKDYAWMEPGVMVMDFVVTRTA